MAEQPRIVLVTGASGALGRAVVTAFRTLGDRVVALDRHARTADDGLIHVAADLADAAAVKAAVDQAIAAAGSAIDVLVNVAGGFDMGPPVHETGDDLFDRMLDMNTRSMLNTARAVVPGMLARKAGKIVSVAAAAGLKANAHMGAYAVSKSAVIRLTEAMSAELRGSGINVNCVLPTIIDTPANRAAMPKADPAKWVSPDDLARVIVFLASHDACAIHGAALPVTGLS